MTPHRDRSASPASPTCCARVWHAALAAAMAVALTGLGGCAVVMVAGAVTGAAISVTGAVVASGVTVTGKMIGKTVDLVLPSAKP